MSGGFGSVGTDLKEFLNPYSEILDFDENQKLEADIFLHLAAKNPVHSSKSMIHSNIIYLEKIISYCEDNGIKEFIFFSSTSAYGSLNQEYITEECNTSSKIDIYGVTKLLGEKLIQNSNLKALCLRCPSIIAKNTKYNFWSLVLDKLYNNESIKLTNADKNFNALISTSHIAEFLLKANFKIQFDILNMVSYPNYSLYDLVNYLKNLLNSHSKIEKSDQYQCFSSFSNQKLNKYLKYSFDSKETFNHLIF